MKHDETHTDRPRFQAATVQGEPYFVNGRQLTPVARILSFGRARATVGTHQTGGWGAGFALVVPLAVEVERDGEQLCIPVVDATGAALRRMFGGAVAIVLVFALIRRLARQRPQTREKQA